MTRLKLEVLMNYIQNKLNYYLDGYRTSIPSNDEMLIRNLPEVQVDRLWDELTQIDAAEEQLLSTDVEKRITKIRDEHLMGPVVGIAVATAIEGLGISVGILN